MSESEREWYVRRGSAVQGPFTLEQIHRYVLLGRVRLTDRVSEDGESWSRVTQCPDLIPDDMRDLGSEEGLARFEAARRAVDEREPDEDNLLRVGGERSSDPSPTTGGPSLLRHAVLVPALLVAVAILLTAVWLYQG